jgi:hypothetical protein
LCRQEKQHQQPSRKGNMSEEAQHKARRQANAEAGEKLYSGV